MKQFKLFLACLVIFFTTATLTTFAQPNLGVYPTILEYHLASGQSESKAIHLTNNSPDTVQFRLYINDWYRDTMGGHAYFRADTLPQSCAKWMSTDKNFIQLETGKSTDVTVKLSLPDDGSATDKMRWAMLFIETVEEKKNDQKDYKENQVKEESDLPDKPMKEIGKINKQVDHPIEGEKVKYVYPKQDKKEKAHLVKGGKGKQLNLSAHKIKSK